MSKVEGGEGVPIDPPKTSCNYFFFEASRIKHEVLSLYMCFHKSRAKYLQ